MAQGHRVGRRHIKLLSVSQIVILCAIDLRMILVAVDLLTSRRADSSYIIYMAA